MSRLKELEQRVARQEHQLRLLQQISRFLVRGPETKQALNDIVQLVAEFMECDSCLLYLLESDDLVLFASNNPHPQSIGKLRLKLSEGLTGWVARERRLLAISRESYHDPRFKLFNELPEDTFEAFLSAPIVFRQRVVGVINVQHRETHPHDGSEMETLTTVGEQVGCLLELARATAVDKARPELAVPDPATLKN